MRLLSLLSLAVLTALTGCFETPLEKEPISPALKKEIDYGRELIVHTAKYLGPKGSGRHYLRARMNCQNCHLDGGTKPFGISLRSVHGRYPDYRAREGKVLSLAERTNNCIEHPMNGDPLPLDSREMQAILAYFRFLAQDIPTGRRLTGDRLNDIIQLPTRAADPLNGEKLYEQKCARCHGPNGQGQPTKDGVEFFYPPLWGSESYSIGSSMHRNIKLAAFIRANMPLDEAKSNPALSNEEAFDLAAFINDERKRPRPLPRREVIFAKPEEKPIDYPYGPYADPFTEDQHRLGPFPPIIDYLRKKNQSVYW